MALRCLNSEATSPSVAETDANFIKLWNTYKREDCRSNPFYLAMLQWCEECAEESAVMWFNSSGEATHNYSRIEFFSIVRRTALYLTEALDLKVGDKVILCYPPELQFNVVFLACLISGIVPVPVYPPDPSRPGQDIERFVRIKQTAGAAFTLTTSAYKKVAVLLGVQTRNSEWKRVKWVCTNDIKHKDIDYSKFVAPELHYNSLAFLQFTSGSTADPKGVMVTHGALLHNVHLNLRGIDICSSLEDPDTNISFSQYPYHEYWNWAIKRNNVSRRVLGHGIRICSWLPVYHDMGLIGCFCAPVFFGYSMCLMSPITFIRKPHIWLQVISAYECVATAAPNFAYELVCRKMPDDVYEKLNLKYAAAFLCGAEQIRACTIKKFVEKFAPKGFRLEAFLSAYGLAENTLGVCGRDRYNSVGKILRLNVAKLEAGSVEIVESGSALTCNTEDTSESKSIVSCGIAYEGVDVRVADPLTCKELEEGKQGEIWVRSASTAIGYFNMPEETKQTFCGALSCLNDEISAPNFLRTGDFGFMLDKEIYITGRIKDMLIVRGRKYYPQDIEKAVETCPDIRPGCVAAFSTESGGVEVLCVLAEVRKMAHKGVARLVPGISKRTNEKRYVEIAKTIVAAISYSFRLHAHTVCLLPARQIPKTTSGKTQRSLCKDRLLKGQLTILYSLKPIEQTLKLAHEVANSLPLPLLSQHNDVDAAVETSESEIEPVGITGKFSSAAFTDANSNSEIINHVSQIVKDCAREVLGITDEINPDAPLMELGVDSLAAVEISERIAKALDIELDATILFEHPTVRHLIVFLVELHCAQKYGKATDTSLALTQNGTISPIGDVSPSAVINIVGASCRLPGQCCSIEDLWDLMIESTDAIVPIPTDRWNVNKLYDPDPEAEGKMYIREGGFIENIDLFDAEFFKISNFDAKAMDPQQRLLLEVSYEALSNTGYNNSTLQRANIGVFVGCCSNDWSYICSAAGDKITAYTAINHAPSILSNRVSFALGVVGPSVTIDTACSSSLVAMHMAILEIQNRCCDAAVVAGVNIMLSPHVTVAFCKAGMMAPDARCKTFDARANGYVRGEGVASIVLQRQSAESNAKPLAVVRGCAINHGGRAACLTAPMGSGQQAVVEMALRRANLKPCEVDVIEAHGTGTALGDPIEIGALKALFAADRQEKHPLILSALKPNVGHLEGASGLAGILKAILIAQHNIVPRILHLKDLNSRINTTNFHVSFPMSHTTAHPNYPDRKVTIGVSSFGFGGANAHIIIQSAAISCDPPTNAATQHVNPPKIAFLFTGQGSQYSGMGQQLFESEPIFEEAIKECAAIIDPKLPVPLLHLLYPNIFVTSVDLLSKYETLIHTAEVAQPAIFAIEYAVARLLASQGVKPDAVLGHSFGEYAAAVAAGIMKLEDGLNLVLERARLTADTPSQNGVMVAARILVDDAEEAINRTKKISPISVSVAAYNGPRNVVFSGPADDINKLIQENSLVDRCKFLQVSHAFHCPLMTPVVEPIKKIAEKIKYNLPCVTYVSCCTGKISTAEVQTAEYWAEHVIRPVKFMQGIQTLEAEGTKVFLEVGPSPVMISMGRQCVKVADAHTWLSVLQKGSTKSEIGFLSGLRHSDRKFCRLRGQSCIQWNHTKFPLKSVALHHSFVGSGITPRKHGNDSYYDVIIPSEMHEMMLDHVINGAPLMPAAAFIELALAILNLWSDKVCNAELLEVCEIEILHPLVLPEICKPLKVTVIVKHSGDFIVQTSDDSTASVVHVQGSFCSSSSKLTLPDFNVIRQRIKDNLPIQDFYSQLHRQGLHYRSRFQCIKELMKGENEVIAKLCLVDAFPDDEKCFFLHPALLDAAFQSSAALVVGKNKDVSGIFVPAAVSYVTASKLPTSELWSYTTLNSMDPNTISVDVHLYTADFVPVASIKKLCLRRFDIIPIAEIPSEFLWTVDWQEKSNTTQHIGNTTGSVTECGLEGSSRSVEKITNSILIGLPNFMDQVSVRYCPDSTNSIIRIDSTLTKQFIEELIVSHTFDWVIYFGSLDNNVSNTNSVHHVLTILQACHAVSTKQRDITLPNLVILTCGAQQINNEKINERPYHSDLVGVARSARFELDIIEQNMQITYVDLDPAMDMTDALSMFNEVAHLLQRIKNEPMETEIAIRNKTHFVSKLRKSDVVCQGSIQLYMKSRGVISNLQVIPLANASRLIPEGNECELRVRAIGLNFRDVLNVMDLYPGDPGPPGADVAGTIVSVGDTCSYKIGDRVFGLASGCLKSYVATSSDLLAPMPNCMSFEAAAALPVVAVTVELALGDLANVKKGENVLIHAASGGVGITAIQFCKRVGANVFGTVGSEEKKLFLESMGVKVIASSRDVGKFKATMEAATHEYGPVHVTLNCLVDEFIPASLNIMAPGGRFMELGKRGIWTEKEIHAARPDVYYEAIAVDSMAEADPAWFGKMLKRVSHNVEIGHIEGLPLKVYNMYKGDEGVEAFKYLQRAKHIGKVVISIPSSLDVLCEKDEKKKSQQMRESDKTYVITGGAGGLGLVLCRWLIEEGATNLVLLSRRGAEAVDKQLKSVQWLDTLANEVNVTTIKCDVSKKDDIMKTFKEIADSDMPPIRGIFHAAGVLQDAEFYKQDQDRIVAVYNPKVIGAWNLHDVCEELQLNEKMEVFMMFSSITAVIGNIGQTTYAAANAALDALVKYRKSMGLCGQSIQWGPWIEQGMAASFKDHLVKVGMKGISNELGLRVLGDVMRKHNDACVIGCQEFVWGVYKKRFTQLPLFYSNVTTTSCQPTTASSAPSASASELAILSKSRQELAEMLVDLAKDTCTGNSSKIGVDVPLMDVDLDSLGLMEFRNVVFDKTGIKPPQTLLFENPTMLDIADYIQKKRRSEEVTTSPPSSSSSSNSSSSSSSVLSSSPYSSDTKHANGQRVDSQLQHPSYENDQSTLDKSISNWLRSTLCENNRHLKYIDAFSKAYETVRQFVSVPDVATALDELNVTDLGDRRILTNTYCSLKAIASSASNTCINLNQIGDDNQSRISTAVATTLSDQSYLNTRSTLPASPVPAVYSPPASTMPLAPENANSPTQPMEDVESVVNSLRFDISALKKPCLIHRIQRVLLTGATGFIGRLQLVNMLKLSAFPKLLMYCLVRANSKEHAMQRIQDACETARCWKPEFRNRIVPVLGDLRIDRFGLSELEFKKLCQDIDVVYHNGADINLFKSYARIREVNVLSMRNILSLCTTHRLKPLHFTSTLGMFPAYFASFQREHANVEVTERCRPKENEMQFFPSARMGYPWSKWAGELILTKAKSMGVPVTIYRLPVTCMTYETGYTHTDNVNIPLACAVLQEGLIPYGIIFTALSAADVVCDLLVELSLTKGRKHWLYHLVDTRVAVRTLFLEWFDELGLKLRCVTPDEFLNTIKNRGSDSALFEFIPMIQFWRHYWFADGERSEPQPISTRNILDDLPHRTSPWPPLREVFKRSFLYNVRTNLYKANAEPLKTDVRLYLDEFASRSNLGSLPNSSFFLKPATLLHDSLNTSKAVFAGRYFTFRLVKQMLDNAVFLENISRIYPQVQTVPIKKAIFIVGLDRISTTLMQWLLAQDSTNRTPRFCEMALPYGPHGNYRPHDLNAHSWENDPRARDAQDILDGILALSDGAAFEDLIRADLPFDDSVIFEQFGRSHSISMLVDAPEYHKWLQNLTDEEMDEVYLYHKKFLQHLQWQKPGERWVLNSAFHLFSLGSLFKIYPGATVIWIHRDPKLTAKSWCQFSSGFKGVLYDTFDLKTSDKATIKIASTLLTKALEYRESNVCTDNRIIDVQYETFVQDPLATVKRIYKSCGMSLSNAALKAMKLFLLEHRHLRNELVTAPAFGFGNRSFENEPLSLSDKEISDEFYSYSRCRYTQQLKTVLSASHAIDQIVAGAAAMLFKTSTPNKKNKLARNKTINEGGGGVFGTGGKFSLSKANLFSTRSASNGNSKVPRLKTM